MLVLKGGTRVLFKTPSDRFHSCESLGANDYLPNEGVRMATATSATRAEWPTLIAGLPLLNPFYRVDQHYDVQNQAVSDPEEQHYLHCSEQGQ
jgi:hypothetical protein